MGGSSLVVAQQDGSRRGKRLNHRQGQCSRLRLRGICQEADPQVWCSELTFPGIFQAARSCSFHRHPIVLHLCMPTFVLSVFRWGPWPGTRGPQHGDGAPAHDKDSGQYLPNVLTGLLGEELGHRRFHFWTHAGFERHRKSLPRDPSLPPGRPGAPRFRSFFEPNTGPVPHWDGIRLLSIWSPLLVMSVCRYCATVLSLSSPLLATAPGPHRERVPCAHRGSVRRAKRHSRIGDPGTPEEPAQAAQQHGHSGLSFINPWIKEPNNCGSACP